MNKYIISKELLEKLMANSEIALECFDPHSFKEEIASFISNDITEVQTILNTGPIKPMTEKEILQVFEKNLMPDCSIISISSALNGWKAAFKYMEKNKNG